MATRDDTLEAQITQWRAWLTVVGMANKRTIEAAGIVAVPLLPQLDHSRDRVPARST